MNTSSSNPSFRTDLVAQPVSDAGQRFVDVTDPDSGRTFRFYEVEYSLACAMDGRRDLRQLADWALDELGLEASREELESVIGTLADLGYLEGLEPSSVSNVPVVAEPVELGVAGGAPITAEAGPAIAAEPLELGAPGRGAVPRERPAMPQPEPVELGTAGPPGRGGPQYAREESFEGLIEEPPTEVRHVPALPPRTVKAPEPPAPVIGAPVTDDFMEGITPPPQEQPSASLRPVTQPHIEEDGPTNLPQPATDYDEEEVSVDLSAHLSIGAEDVKEAVRQSRVMHAVEVPADLAAELDQREQPMAPPPPATPAPVHMLEDASTPIELPEPPARPRRDEQRAPQVQPPVPPREVPEPRRGVSPILWVLLILALGGAGAYYYFFVYKKQQEGEGGKTPVAGPRAPGGKQPAGQPPAGKQPGGKPPGGEQPAAPTAVLALSDAPAPAELTAPAAGMVPWMADAGAQVAQGDDVVRLKDHARHARKLAEFENRLEHYQGKLADAQARLDKAKADGAAGMIKVHEAKVAEYTAKVKEKQDGVAESKQGMAAATLTAPIAGTVEHVSRPGQWVKQGEVLVRIGGGQPQLTASFTVGDGKTYETGSEVQVAAGADSAACKVTGYAAGKLTVACPTTGPLKAGSEVTLP